MADEKGEGVSRMDKYLKVRADTFHPLYNITSQQTEAAWLGEGRLSGRLLSLECSAEKWPFSDSS